MYQEAIDLSLAKARLHLSEVSFSLPKKILDIISEEYNNFNLYPEPGSKSATKALSALWGIHPSKVVLSNGCDEAILNTFLKFGITGNTVVSSNSYPGYIEIAQLSGQKIKQVPLNNLLQDIDKIIKSIDQNTKLAILCNPHNPTGTLLSIDKLDYFIKNCNKKNIIPVIDEAYIDYSPEGASLIPYIDRYEKIIIWRSFSKSHGLAGIRLGAAVGTPLLISKLQEAACCNPFSVNRISQRIILEISKDESHFIENRRRILFVREKVQNELKKLNVWYNPSNANFLFIKAPQQSNGIDFYRETGIYIRDCSSYDLNGYWRVSCGKEEEMKLFTNAIKENVWKAQRCLT